MKLKFTLTIGSAVAALFAGSPVYAEAEKPQDSEAADSAGLAEIVVTARKRDENVQDIPVTVSVLTDEMLNAAQVRNGFDLAALTPGFSYESTGVASNNKPVIRGATTNSTAPTQQKNSSFVDGFYISGTTTPPPFLDIARVEVLKGPQSAAFGRATFAGAINYVTKDPGNTLEGIIQATAATDSEYEIGALIGGPINNWLKAQASGYYRTFDGNDEWRNSNGRKLGGEKTYYGSVKLVADLSETVRLETRYAYLNLKNGPSTVLFLDPGASSAANRGDRNTQFTRPNGSFTFYPTGELPLTGRPYNFDFTNITDAGTDVKKHRLSAELTIDAFDGHTLTLSGARNIEHTIDWQTDLTQRRCFNPTTPPTPVVSTAIGACTLQDQDYDDWQLEGRIASDANRPFSYLLGVNYIKVKQDYLVYQPVTGASFFAVPSEDIKSWSFFGSAAWTPIERLRLGVEARYNIDDAEYVGYGFCGIPATGVARVPGAACTATFRGSAAPVAIADPFTGQTFAQDLAQKSFKAFLYRATIDFRPTDDLLLYGIVSKGNQPGRFNLGLPTAFDAFRVVEEEELMNYEAGLKATLFDGRATLNLAAYRMDWSNQTFRRTLQLLILPNGSVQPLDPSVPLPPGATTALQTIFVNAGSSRIQGIEFETSLRPFDGFDLRGTLAYTDAKFREFCSDLSYQLTGVESVPGGRCRSVEGNTLDAQPKWTWSVSAGYSSSLGTGEWKWFVRGDYFHTGRKFESEANLAYVPDADVLNARLGVDNGNYSIEIFGNNLTKEDAPYRANRLTDGSIPLASVGSPSAASTPGVSNQNNVAYVPRRDRQFGIRASMKF
jgi:iron complex outermembrane recepter protein